MQSLLQQYANYNLWANKRIIDVLLQLEMEQLNKELVSSFSTIQATVYHTWSAEFIWLQRLQLVEQHVWIEHSFKGSFAEACADWQQVSESLINFIKQKDDHGLQQVIEYYSTEGQFHKLPAFTILNHVFNHATFHRGQLITMLRQVGVTRLPVTDLGAFAYEIPL